MIEVLMYAAAWIVCVVGVGILVGAVIRARHEQVPRDVDPPSGGTTRTRIGVTL